MVECEHLKWLLPGVVVSALSYLVSASYTEDVYGVVQQSLAEILTTLLNLYEVS